MIITLITGEKYKVIETMKAIRKDLSHTSSLLKLTVKETKIVRGSYQEVETPVYFRIEHIVSYEETNT